MSTAENTLTSAEAFEVRFHRIFDFLDEEQRQLALDCVREEDRYDYIYAFQALQAVEECRRLHGLVRELCDHIDTEAIWRDTERKTPEQIREELSAAGIDADAGFNRLQKLLGGHGFKPRTREEWRAIHEQEYRQLMGL